MAFNRHSVINNNNFQFEGWVYKRRQDQTFLFNEDYQKRYLAINSTSLLYFHSKTYETKDIDSYDGCIPLSVICEVKLSTNDIGLFFIDIGSRIFTFKVESIEVAGLWVENIINARHFLLNKVLNRSDPYVVTPQLAQLKFWRSKRAGSTVKDLLLVDPFTSNEVDAILRIEEILLSNKTYNKALPNAFFHAIQSFPKKFQNDRSRELGISLILWLANQGDAQEIKIGWNESYLHGSSQPKNDTKSSHNEIIKGIFQDWFESSLAIELNKSCDLHRNNPSVKINEDSPQQDMPFRSDTPEVLFITSTIRTSIQASAILSQWLSSAILAITSAPDNYTFTSVKSFNINTETTSQPINQPTNQLANSPIKIKNNYLKLQISSKVFNHHDDNVYFHIIRLCSLVIQKIHVFKLHLPESLVIFINVLKNLILNNNYDWSNQFNNNHITTRLFDIPNEKVFFMSFTGVIFLRLICPAIISPIEWGSLRNIHSLAKSSSSTTNSTSSNTASSTANSTTKKKTNKSLNYSKRISLTPSYLSDRNKINVTKFGCPTPFIVLLCYVLNQLDESTLNSYLVNQNIELSNEFIRLIRLVGSKVEFDKIKGMIESFLTKITSLSESDRLEIDKSGCNLESNESRRSLIEIAKVLQKIANMSCMSESDMDGFLSTDMLLHKKRTSDKTGNYNLLVEDENIFIQELKSAALMLKKFYIDCTIDKSARKSIFK